VGGVKPFEASEVSCR